jgi:protein SCO1/2
MRVITALCASLLLGLAPASAQQDYDRDAALALSQGVIGAALGDHTLRDTQGQPFHLRNLRGKPLVISLIYTSCHHVCPLITRNVAEKMEIAQDALGNDAFTVITVGFDWRVDTPERMRTYANGQGIDIPGWHFLSGDAATIAALSDDLGFQFFPSAKGFDHLSQTTVVDANGVVYRQIYGVDFDTQTFVEPLKELVFDTPREAGFAAHWMDTFRLFCTVYDPNSGRYEFDYSIFMTIFVGTLCLGSILVFIVREWRHSR